MSDNRKYYYLKLKKNFFTDEKMVILESIVDIGRWIESAADLCEILLDDVADDVFEMTRNDHSLENADPLELAEIKRRWKAYIDQLPEYSFPV